MKNDKKKPMQFYVTAELEVLIKKAAKLRHMSVATFVRSAAHKEAKEVIKEEVESKENS